jgi:hypothetical protein
MCVTLTGLYISVTLQCSEQNEVFFHRRGASYNGNKPNYTINEAVRWHTYHSLTPALVVVFVRERWH